MCVGLARTDDMVRSAAAGIGNVVVLMGASTGRDGIGGASVLASAELGTATTPSAPACRSATRSRSRSWSSAAWSCWARGCSSRCRTSGLLVLTSSAAEMASGGGTGIDIDVTVLREADMEPFEIMVSESQERMLAVVEPDRVDRVVAICEKWAGRPRAGR